MANSVTIDRTVFQTIDAEGVVVDTTYGVRVYDNEGATYSNYVESFEELKAMTPEQLVELAAGIDNVAADMISFAKENGTTIFVDGEAMPSQSTASPSI